MSSFVLAGALFLLAVYENCVFTCASCRGKTGCMSILLLIRCEWSLSVCFILGAGFLESYLGLGVNGLSLGSGLVFRDGF
jgi:hypothetical protein